MGRRTLDELLRDARATIERLEPAEAWAATHEGALIVDTRVDRSAGVVPGSLHVPLSVLQWRVAPDSAWRNPHVGGLDTRLILICDHGESSSLAAASLRELGFARAGDVVGGFEAWLAAGLPVAEAPVPSDGLPGMDSPA
ncbi:MAG: putative rhodanese [Actinomycetia bacterium]|nr:putative rhodanese [Actinomycetes bacterium]